MSMALLKSSDFPCEVLVAGLSSCYKMPCKLHVILYDNRIDDRIRWDRIGQNKTRRDREPNQAAYHTPVW